MFSPRPPPRAVARRPAPSRERTVEIRPRIDGLVYAIGDVHGRLDLLERLIDQIRVDCASAADDGLRPQVILLGDLIDRGPQSAGCLERAIALSAEGWCEVEALLGNHEEALQLFLQDHTVGPNWIQHGGAATIESYGVDVTKTGAGKGWLGVQAAFEAALPPHHLAFVNGMKLWLERDDYLFVHAGVRPGAPIERQAPADLLWIRDAFLSAERPYPGKVVVHGHTPVRQAELRRWRIGVDTGAYASGLLTAVRLKGYERALLQTL